MPKERKSAIGLRSFLKGLAGSSSPEGRAGASERLTRLGFYLLYLGTLALFFSSLTPLSALLPPLGILAWELARGGRRIPSSRSFRFALALVSGATALLLLGGVLVGSLQGREISLEFPIGALLLSVASARLLLDWVYGIPRESGRRRWVGALYSEAALLLSPFGVGPFMVLLAPAFFPSLFWRGEDGKSDRTQGP